MRGDVKRRKYSTDLSLFGPPSGSNLNSYTRIGCVPLLDTDSKNSMASSAGVFGVFGVCGEEPLMSAGLVLGIVTEAMALFAFFAVLGMMGVRESEDVGVKERERVAGETRRDALYRWSGRALSCTPKLRSRRSNQRTQKAPASRMTSGTLPALLGGGRDRDSASCETRGRAGRLGLPWAPGCTWALPRSATTTAHDDSQTQAESFPTRLAVYMGSLASVAAHTRFGTTALAANIMAVGARYEDIRRGTTCAGGRHREMQGLSESSSAEFHS